MSKEEFCAQAPQQTGEILWNHFQELLKQSGSIRSACTHQSASSKCLPPAPPPQLSSSLAPLPPACQPAYPQQPPLYQPQCSQMPLSLFPLQTPPPGPANLLDPWQSSQWGHLQHPGHHAAHGYPAGHFPHVPHVPHHSHYGHHHPPHPPDHSAHQAHQAHGLLSHAGPVQLWQFLLELLSERSYQHIIAWTGNGWEFKLKDPDEVRNCHSFFYMIHTLTYNVYSFRSREGGVLERTSQK